LHFAEEMQPHSEEPSLTTSRSINQLGQYANSSSNMPAVTQNSPFLP